jgi:Protein of unknown function (DUF2642)
MEGYALCEIQQYIGKAISLEVAGGRFQKGTLIDFGPDIIVVFDGIVHNYYYIPLAHIKYFKPCPQEDPIVGGNLQEQPVNSETGLLVFSDVIEKAKDILLELYVTGNYPAYGYITDVLSDYLLFNSPVYRTMAININHVKWLALTEKNQTFYSKDRTELEIPHTLNAVTAPTFQQQLNKMIGKIVVFDMGIEPNKIGLVVSVSCDYVVLINANEETHFLNINHIKTFHL